MRHGDFSVSPDSVIAACPFDFYRTWVTGPVLGQKQVEKITRPTIGAEATRVSGIPRPGQ